jgi:uncharacterized DUF497 family protein
VEFLFDRAKDRINRNKHGISLSRAEDFDYDAPCMWTMIVRTMERYGYGPSGFWMLACSFSYLRSKVRIFERSA